MGKSLRVAYGEALVKLGQTNDKVVALDADPSNIDKQSTQLSNTLSAKDATTYFTLPNVSTNNLVFGFSL